MKKLIMLSLILLVSFGHSNSKSLLAAEDSADTFMELVNDHRQTLGLRPLTHDEGLGKIAFAHSKAMARGSVTFGHTGFSLRCSDSRKVLGGGNWCAENVARGQKSMRDAFIAWMNSSGHRANLEKPRATHTGLAFAKSSGGKIYWTQIFMER